MQTRVLFIRSDVKLAGPGRLMLSSALALRAIGVDVIFATSGGAMVSDIESAGFVHLTLPYLAVGKRSIIGMLRTAWVLHQIVRQSRITVIHSYNAHAGLVAVLARYLNRTRQFNTVHGNGHEKLLRFMPFKLIAVSQSVSDKLQEFGVPKSKIRVIYNATLDDSFILPDRAAFDKLQMVRAEITPFTFISVAIFTGQKGHAEVLDAVSEYQTRTDAKPIRMVFVGDGPQQAAMKDYAAQLGLEDILHFEGASDNVSMHLDCSHAFIHLAEMETFGMVIAEANARGLPVIAANVGGIPEVLENGATGVLVDRENAKEVANVMARFVDDQDLTIQYGWSGAQRAAKLFQTKNMSVDLHGLYHDPWKVE